MGAPTKELVGRIRHVAKAVGVSERELSRLAGVKSPTHLAATMQRESDMGWDNLGPIVDYLVRGQGVTLEWLFLGELPMVKSGATARREAPTKVERSPDVAPLARKNRRRTEGVA